MIPVALIRGKDKFHLSGIKWTYCGLLIDGNIKNYPEGPLDLPMCKRCNKHIIRTINDIGVGLAGAVQGLNLSVMQASIALEAMNLIEAVSRYKPKVKKVKA